MLHNFLLFISIISLTTSCTNNKNIDQANSEINNEHSNSIFIDPSQNCIDLPVQFPNYSEAVNRIKHASFQIQDAANTSKSSWIREASYYSCDGQSGYFMLLTDKKNYVFQGMPISIWQGFKGADSFGEYYHAHIRDRCFMYVGQN